MIFHDHPLAGPSALYVLQALPRTALTRLYLAVSPGALSDGLEGDMQRKKCEADARSLRRCDRRDVTRDSLNSMLWAMAR